jgi:hypothetical protein
MVEKRVKVFKYQISHSLFLLLLLIKLSKKRGTIFFSFLKTVTTHPFIATYKGNCIIANMLTGKNAAQ